MRDQARPRSRKRGFTLIELLVVITIIILVSAATLPAVLPALNHRQVSEAARILQGALVGARDSAIRFNEPRGIRLLPDPVLTQPALAAATVTAGAGGTFTTTAGTLTLCYDRIVPIEPAPDYSEGTVSIYPLSTTNLARPLGNLNILSIPYPNQTSATFPPPQASYPYGPLFTTGQVLMIEQCVYLNDTPPIPNTPTSWFWNIRVGDKIRLSDSGRYYTIVGPMNLGPTSTPVANPEMFVNVGAPGATSPLLRNYMDSTGTTVLASPNPEFLFVVNGQDDNLNGLVDEGWDGIDNNYDGIIDDLAEWEVETFVGPVSGQGFTNQTYTIIRRPVPTQGAREVNLPPQVVIDATSWNLTRERSRLPIDVKTLYADIMLDTNGQVIPTHQYSSPASFNYGAPFYHFWLTEREGVHAVNELWPSLTNGNLSLGAHFLLPLPQETYANAVNTSVGTALTSVPQINLTGERRLLTLFTRNGMLTNNAVESSANASVDSFNAYDVNQPFYYPQSGGRGEVE